MKDASSNASAKRAAGEAAAELVSDRMVVGLGTGSTVAWTIKRLGERVSSRSARISSTSAGSTSEPALTDKGHCRSMVPWVVRLSAAGLGMRLVWAVAKLTRQMANRVAMPTLCQPDRHSLAIEGKKLGTAVHAPCVHTTSQFPPSIQLKRSETTPYNTMPLLIQKTSE